MPIDDETSGTRLRPYKDHVVNALTTTYELSRQIPFLEYVEEGHVRFQPKRGVQLS